jgi:hypothetical protein
MVSGECGLPAWLPHHDRLGAVTTVIYQRRSFRDLSTGMRITLDSGVTITAPAVPGEPLAGSGEKADLPHVLEAKGSGPLPEWLRAACAALGVTPVGFSKYQLAMERRRRALTNTTASKSNANPAPGAPPELEQAIG